MLNFEKERISGRCPSAIDQNTCIIYEYKPNNTAVLCCYSLANEYDSYKLGIVPEHGLVFLMDNRLFANISDEDYLKEYGLKGSGIFTTTIENFEWVPLMY